jgi:hypothetical protein
MACGYNRMSAPQWKGDLQSIIHLQVQSNPKRMGRRARERFNLYRDGWRWRSMAMPVMQRQIPQKSKRMIFWWTSQRTYPATSSDLKIRE